MSSADKVPDEQPAKQGPQAQPEQAAGDQSAQDAAKADEKRTEVPKREAARAAKQQSKVPKRAAERSSGNKSEASKQAEEGPIRESVEAPEGKAKGQTFLSNLPRLDQLMTRPAYTQDPVSMQLEALSTELDHFDTVLASTKDKDAAFMSSEEELLALQSGLVRRMLLTFPKGQPSARQAYLELAGLCREMRTVAAALPDQSARLDAVNQLLKKLQIFGRALDATAPGIHFATIANASKALSDTVEETNQYLSPWNKHLLKNVLDPLRKDIRKLSRLSKTVQGRAQGAMLDCDTHKINRACEDIFRQFASIRQHTNNFINHLNQLDSTPEVEPSLVSELRSSLHKAGYHLAQMVNAYQQIEVQDPDAVTELANDWQAVQKLVQEVAQENERWAKTQPNPQLNFYSTGTAELMDLTDQALKFTEMLRTEPWDVGVRTKLDELAAQTHSQVSALFDQAASAKGYQVHIFEGFWLPLAQIRLQLCGCDEIEEDKATTTQRQLAQSVVGSDEGNLVQMQQPTKLPARAIRQKAQPAQAPTRQLTQIAPIPNATATLEIWKKAEEMATQLYMHLPRHNDLQVQTLIRQTQREQERLQAELTTPMVNDSLVREQMGRRWNQLYTMLNALYTMTLDTALSTQRRELEPLGQQLSLLGQQMHHALHPPRKLL
jgi:hypothetical protein